MAGPEDTINVATVYGAGVGRFLAAALADALGSGIPLVAVRDARAEPLAGKRGIDFVFAHADSRFAEVIRVGVEISGNVVSAQIVRGRPEPDIARHPAESGLRMAIQAGDSVSTLLWKEGTAAERAGILAITMSTDHVFAIPLDDGEGQNASRVAGPDTQIAPRPGR